MINIGDNFSGNQNGLVGNFTGLSERNKQAWLDSMVKSGLVKALNDTQVLKNELSKSPAASEPLPTTSEATLKISDEGFRTVLNTQNEVLTQASMNARDATISSFAGSSLKERASDSLTEILPLVIEMNNSTLTEEMTGPMVEAKVKYLQPQNIMRWAPNNLIATHSADGVEVWVRDSKLTDQVQIKSFLQGLRQTFGKLGASLVKVVINGQVVSQDNNSNVGHV